MAFLVLISTLLISFLGAMQPSIVNVGTIRIAAQHGQKQALYFALGGTLPELVYATIAIVLLDQLDILKQLMPYLMSVVILLFLIMGIKLLFFDNALKTIDLEKRNNSFFMSAFIISSINFAVLFFWISSAGILSGFSIQADTPLAMVAFVAGAGLGNFLLLFSLTVLVSKLSHICTPENIKRLNQISGLIFVCTALFTAFNLYLS
jgi:threonine/homoserine/homoserine lactone efflux protein